VRDGNGQAGGTGRSPSRVKQKEIFPAWASGGNILLKKGGYSRFLPLFFCSEPSTIEYLIDMLLPNEKANEAAAVPEPFSEVWMLNHELGRRDS